MNDTDLSKELEEAIKFSKELVERLSRAYKESQAFAKGYIELGNMIKSNGFEKEYSGYQIVKMLCDKYEAIRNSTETLENEET